MQEILNILGSVGFNWHVALANFFNFLIILFLLNKFFFKKLGKTINERHSVIERGLNQAKDAEKALASADEEKRNIIQSAHKERDSIVSAADATAKELASRIEEAAYKEVATRLKKIDEMEASLSESVEKAFREKAPALVAKMYAKTLLQEMTEQDNNALITRMKA
jgi:F-type H+-transporting ATPase subunit b